MLFDLLAAKKKKTYSSRIVAGTSELLEAKQPRSSVRLSTIRINVGREEHGCTFPFQHNNNAHG